MGATRTDIHSKQQIELAALAKSLAHPARIAILEHLMKSNTCITGDLVKEIGLAQPTITQHLKELKKINLISGTVEGTSVCYCINAERWTEVKDEIVNWFGLFQDGTCC